MMRKIINSIFDLIVIFIIIVTSTYLVSTMHTINDPAHIPSILGFAPLTVISGSMSPGIETGDMIVIIKNNSSIKPGDIITYRLAGVLVTHRVKEISRDAVKEVFVTQGDANSVSDYKTVDRSQIVGKYLFRIPFGGYIKACLRGMPGILLLFGLVLVAFMLEVYKLTQNKLREVEKCLYE